MQTRNLNLAAAVQEYDYASCFRMHRRVISGWNRMLVPITRSDRERLKWRCVQQLSNSRNHERKLSELFHSLNCTCNFCNPQLFETFFSCFPAFLIDNLPHPRDPRLIQTVGLFALSRLILSRSSAARS